MTGEEDGARRVDGDRGGARWPALGFRGRGPARRSSAAEARVPGRGGRGRGTGTGEEDGGGGHHGGVRR